MREWFYPVVTGRTFFDSSSIIHLCFWVFYGSCPAYAKWPLERALILGFLIAFAWEFFERSAEGWWPHVWQHPESALNAYLSDAVLTTFVGTLIGYWCVRVQK
jgi:hypothetical protein